jgi:DNA adenine methylase
VTLSHATVGPEAQDLAKREPIAQPFLKWAGGKSAIARRIASLLPVDARERTYREPFLGGGAMYFYLEPERAYLSDALADLVTAFNVVQTSVEPLIKRLEALAASHTREQYYAIRERFNAEKEAAPLDRAAWLVYLNKTGFNGLFRTNKDGLFNVPIGSYKNPKVVDPERIRLASAVLANAEVTRSSFDSLLETAEPGDLIYFDPPYVPISKTASFAAYSDGGFSLDDQARLASVFRDLDARGCLLALSNSDTSVVRELYAGYDFSPIVAPRAISAKAATRGDTAELLIRNVARYPRR